MDSAQKKECLDLVDEIQDERMTKNLLPAEVPSVLLPYQIKWQKDKSPVRVCQKGRRIGWSWGVASEAVLEAAEEGGMDQFYVGYNLPMAAEFIGDCAFFARAFNIAAGEIDVTMENAVVENERRDIVKFSLKLTSGRKIEALSSNPHNFRGRQGHARLDEAAFHNDLDELMKASLAFLIWGGRVDVISTHNGESNIFNQLIRETQAGKIDYSLHSVTFDDALAEGFFKRICLVKGEAWSQEKEAAFRDEIVSKYGDGADEELFCIPRSGSGVYIPRVVLERCQADGIPQLYMAANDEWVLDDNRLAETDIWINDHLMPVIDNLDNSRRHVYGQDFGRSGDLSVIWVLQEEGGGKWRQAFSVELRNIPFDVQAVIRDTVLDELPHFHHAKFDARGNGQSHAEAAMQKKGPQRIDCVMATATWYSVAFPKYKNAYEDRSITIARSEDVITDHRRIVLDKGRPKMDDGRDKGSDGKYRHGDSAIAGLLAWMATIEEGEPPAGETIEANNDDVYAPESMRGRRRVGMFRQSIKVNDYAS